MACGQQNEMVSIVMTHEVVFVFEKIGVEFNGDVTHAKISIPRNPLYNKLNYNNRNFLTWIFVVITEKDCNALKVSVFKSFRPSHLPYPSILHFL